MYFVQKNRSVDLSVYSCRCWVYEATWRAFPPQANQANQQEQELQSVPHGSFRLTQNLNISSAISQRQRERFVLLMLIVNESVVNRSHVATNSHFRVSFPETLTKGPAQWNGIHANAGLR
jgi:hypothetical protein